MIRGRIPCLWCDGTLADQARASAALFPGTAIDGRDPAAWAPGRVAMLILSENAAPYARGCTEGGSLLLLCDTRAEIDAAWEGLGAEGGQPAG